MELKGKISFRIERDGAFLEVQDDNSGAHFLKIELSQEQLCRVLSREMSVECSMEVFGLSKLGKKRENESFVFEIPTEVYYKRRDDKFAEISKICNETLLKNKGNDWVSDNYYNSQDSFFERGGKMFARTFIRRWV